jgi:hypothetical protein
MDWRYGSKDQAIEFKPQCHKKKKKKSCLLAAGGSRQQKLAGKNRGIDVR